MASNNYVVVFEYTEAVPGYTGVRTSTSFAGPEEFQRWYTPDIQKREKVVEAGEMIEEHRLALVRATPFSAYVKARLQEATVDGQIFEPILRMGLETNLYAVAPPFNHPNELRRWLAYEVLMRPGTPLSKPGIVQQIEALKDNSKPLGFRVAQAIDLATKANDRIDEKFLHVLIGMMIAGMPLELGV